MKSLLEIKKYAPVLLTFFFLAAVFPSCFFDNRQEKRAQRDDKRYYQLMEIGVVVHHDYYIRTGCTISSPSPDQIAIPASNSAGIRCISEIIPDSKFSLISNFDSKEVITVSTVQYNTKLICKCESSQSPLTGENTWYKISSLSSNRAESFFTHKYQKDSSGNIIGVDPFIPTTPGDIFLCNPTCESNYRYYQKITIQ